MSSSPATPRILVAGGGVAALETVLALQSLAGDRLQVELLAPDRHFTYRPLAVAGPFGGAGALRFPLAGIGADRNVTIHRDALAAVRPLDRAVETQDGRVLPYDTLVLALGARPTEGVPGALTFRGPQDAPRVREVVDGLRAGRLRRVAFAAPAGISWTLPMYELALQTAGAVRDAAPTARVSVVTPEPAPLGAFGPAAGEVVSRLLAEAGVALHTGAPADRLSDGALWIGARRLPIDRAIALPRLVGPRPRGIACDRDGFIPVDERMGVRGAGGVYAVGDATDHALKQGGIAAEQADVAAAAIAAAAGAAVAPPAPFRPVLRGLLLTGGGVRYLRRDPSGASEVSADPLWWPAAKIAGRRLAPYLASHLELATPLGGAREPLPVSAS